MKAVLLAERATLGALLLCQPGGGSRAAEWLRPGDFDDPWHREVYRTFCLLGAAGSAPGAEQVGQDMLRRLGPMRANLTWVAGLLHDVPPGANAATYAVMVLEASLRRETAAQGVLLRAGALQSSLDGSAQPMIAVTAMVDARLDHAERRWTAASDQQPPGTGGRSGERPARPRTRVPGGDAALAADRLLSAHPALAARQVAEHEATLIAALLTHPREVGAASGWLRPASLTNRTWRPVYEAMLRLHTFGRPIDLVTVAWETQRGSRSAGAGPDLATMTAKVESAFATDPAHWTRVVAGDHLRAAADGAAASLRVAAANPGLDVGEILETGHILTQALRTAVRPLDASSSAGRRLAAVPALPAPQARRSGPVAG